ncbi:MAG: PAS domain S-box protein [Desulfobacter sp.]|nr:MAG: PAS domain S-box protein [Desulfobacter sp.]
MRISLSLKVFVLFSSLTAMTLILSLVSYSGYRESQLANERIFLFKDFVTQIGNLQSLTRMINADQNVRQKKAFKEELGRTKKIAQDIVNMGQAFPSTVGKRLAGLPALIDHFDQAFSELSQKYEACINAPYVNRRLFKTLQEKSRGIKGMDFQSFYEVVNELWLSGVRIHHAHDISMFPELKKMTARLEEITGDPVLLGPVQKIVKNLEMDYINYLAVKNRQAFLTNTASHFFGVANEAIDDIVRQNRKRQHLHYLAIVCVSLLAICLNLGLWVAASGYFRRFIRSQKQAITAIETEDEEYGFPSPSRDEIGDLSQAMKGLAQSLFRNRERYRAFIDQAADAVIVTGMDGRIIDVNVRACESLDFSRQALLKMNVADIDIAADKNGQKAIIREIMSQNKIVTFYGLQRKKSLETFPVEVRIGMYETDEYDNIEGRIEIPEGRVFISFARDISERRKAEQALKESEKKYRSMMETMQDPVYICAPDFTITYMNPAMVKRVGYDATGEKCYSALHSRTTTCPWCRYDKIFDHQHYTMDVVSPRDGRAYLVSSSPISQLDGSLAKLTIYRDITQVKQLESQLQQSQRMESIGTLAGGIAHDFNNILFPIMGHAEIMLEDIPGDSPLKEGLNQVYQGALRAKELIKQILAFSRQDAGDVTLVTMQPIIKEALKLIRASIPATIDISRDISPDCGAVKADPTKIHQIIMNLCTNAYHAMEETGGELKVALDTVTLEGAGLLTPTMKPGAYNCLTVSDTGIGMDRLVAGKIFDPYFTTKAQGKGTGMGLSVVHGIVSGMGGAIKVHSEPGKGTRFHVYFPVVDTLPGDADAAGPPPVPGGDERILLVDDEESIIRLVQQVLERLGYHVTAKNSSIDTLKLFQSDPFMFDLVITDLAMPKMPGDRLAIELLAIRPDIPIILNTGFSDQMSSESARKMGIRGLLMKPVIKSDLAKMIRNVLDGEGE